MNEDQVEDEMIKKAKIKNKLIKDPQSFKMMRNSNHKHGYHDNMKIEISADRVLKILDDESDLPTLTEDTVP